MWLPLTRRRRRLRATPSIAAPAAITQGPAALTRARARRAKRSPEMAFSRSIFQALLSRRAAGKRWRGGRGGGGATRLRPQQVGNHEGCVVAAAIGIGEAVPELRLQRGTRRVRAEID